MPKTEVEERVPRIYLRIVSECLRVERFASFADLLDAVKCACARHRIPYDGPTVWTAVSLVDQNRHGIIRER